MKKEKCLGCYNDFYNQGGASGKTNKCFKLEDAKIVSKYVAHNNQVPPFKRKERVPDCYTKQGYAYIDTKNIDSKGFWK